MTIRFELLLNGHRVCMAGINGSGVLAIGVARVQHVGMAQEIRLNVGGNGRFTSEPVGRQIVNWNVHESVAVGDAIYSMS